MNKTYESITEQQFNPHLILDVLFLDALGLVDYKSSLFHPFFGESIHLFLYQIHLIEAHKQLGVGCFTQIQKFFNIDSKRFGVQKNISLPKWIKVENNNNEMNPKSQDFEKILTKIFDLVQQIVKQYFLEVINENQEKQLYGSVNFFIGYQQEEATVSNNTQLFILNELNYDVNKFNQKKGTYSKKQKQKQRVSAFQLKKKK